MGKRTISIILVIILVLSFSSCGVPERLALDQDLYQKVKFVPGEDTSSYGAQYQDVLYYVDTWNIIRVTEVDGWPNAEDVLLGWYGFRWWHIKEYYSDTDENPIFLLEMPSLIFL